MAYIAFVLQFAKALVEVFTEMIFIRSFLHGDPHPGNILVSPEAEGRSSFSLGMLVIDNFMPIKYLNLIYFVSTFFINFCHSSFLIKFSCHGK